ncbi:GNAT family N-acetyltransferase [Aspergillus aculeatinus CBS 121060]|uniref:Uncharacterized protein n=1 Tax=Aspergillus aculeatinus CBS 121060 TaxID=1448322 RepID=A0ACD1H199_9EURO|nr:hypothetical protein BO66DRAFT_393934 [Aspergillus aculeatinus CBS 121060]RAH67345.1 hypothetical protein BO66DRAFT_393934 [Aspergillus aculeatinus CBS 121060]
MATPDYVYTFFRISKEAATIRASALQYRALRLEALQVSPGSFSSTHAIESAFTEDDWIARLTVPDREVFICAATPTSTATRPNAETQWIAQVTLRGPTPADQFALPAAANPPAPRPDSEEERWQMLSLFTLPAHRGRGLGAQLCQAALQWLREYRAEPATVQVRLIVKAGNDVTVNLYRRLGFEDAGRATLVEALVANGDEELVEVVRKTHGAVVDEQRQGLVMVMRLRRG